MSSYELIKSAYTRVAPQARRTPVLSSPFLDEIAGRRVWVKAECLQHTGSFKFRGGWAAISALSDAEKARGVITFSSGNHAQGVALAAARHGVSAIIIMPSDAPAISWNSSPLTCWFEQLNPNGSTTSSDPWKVAKSKAMPKPADRFVMRF